VNKPSPHAIAARAEDIRVAIGSARASLPGLGSGERADADIALPAERVAQPELRPVAVEVSYRVGGGPPATRRLSAHLALCPATFDAPTDAVQPLVVFNPRDTWLDHILIDRETRDPARSYARTADGRVAAWMPGPKIRGRDTISVAVTVPPRSGRTLFLCVGDPPPAAPTPLRVKEQGLGTGKGRLVVSNERLAVTFEEARGGTVTSLVSKRTGRQYAAESFGAAYGTFGRYDPSRPATNTAAFVQARLKRQADSAAKIILKENRQPRVNVEVAWQDGPCQATQSYWFVPWGDGFCLMASGKLQGAPEGSELVLTDARFRAEHFTKTYPNFVGLGAPRAGEWSGDDQPHFGWRQGTWVPDILTFMHPPGFDETLSLVRLDVAGSERVRHGFWPQDRPRPGTLAYAWAEYVAELKETEARLALDVSAHRGYHLHARQRRTHFLDLMPGVLLPATFAWGKRCEPVNVAFPKDWFSPYWPARMVVPVPAEKGHVVVGVGPLAEKLGAKPKAFRCVQVNDETDLAEREFEMSKDRERLFVDADPRWGRTLHVYGSIEELPSPLLLAVRSQGIGPESFEKPADGWDFGGQEVAKVGRDGTMGVRLRVGEGGEPAVISNGALMVEPETTYQVVFWARTSTPGALVRSNFYSGPQYDFAQEQINLAADGQWHRYEATVQAGKFPPSVRPVFRLWALGKPQTIDIDDVELKPMAAAPSRVEATAVRIERLW
jgi:hypothetical protein